MQNLPLKDIIRDPNLQIRESLDKDRVDYFATEVLHNLPPVIVYQVDGRYYLSDGFHRYAAYKSKGRTEIPCEIRKGTMVDALANAIQSNSAHGLPFGRKERRRACERVLKVSPERADNWIAQIVGISKNTVARVRAELEVRGEIPKVEKVIRRDGIETPATIEAGVKLTPEPDPWKGKVICGDAFEILKGEPPHTYDLIFVDPPYNISHEDWDQFDDTKTYKDFTLEWLRLVCPLLKPTGRLYICFSYQLLLDYLGAIRGVVEHIDELYPLTFGNIIIWHHLNTVGKPSDLRQFKPTYDVILYWYGSEAQPFTGFRDMDWGNELDTVWDFAIPQKQFKEGKFHKAQKPIALLERIVKLSTKQGDKVLDPFAGSGTTALACLTSARQFKVIEKNPEYVSIIKQRLNNAISKD